MKLCQLAEAGEEYIKKNTVYNSHFPGDELPAAHTTIVFYSHTGVAQKFFYINIFLFSHFSIACNYVRNYGNNYAGFMRCTR